MGRMRVLLAGALTALAVIASGCGSSPAGTANGATLAGDAAKLVPASAVAFASVDSDLGSTQWQRVGALAKTFTNGKSLVDIIDAKLQSKGLSWQDDVVPALGSEVDIAVLSAKPEPDVVALTHPNDMAKLNALVAKLGKGYSVQQIAGWSVVGESQDAFSALRAAQSGQSLADTSTFQAAWSSLSGDLLAQVYVNPPSSGAKGTHADWIAADVRADSDALRIDAVVKPTSARSAPAGASLLGDVPSGASLAISFRGGADLEAKLSSLQPPKELGTSLALKRLAPLLAGGGVAYARANGLVPDIAIELAPKDVQSALATARSLLKSLGTKLGPLQLTTQVANGKLVIADSPAAAAALQRGSKLVDDAAFKDALSKAGVPGQTTFLAYADVPQLAPFVPVVVQAVTGNAPPAQLATTLSHLGTVLAWAARSSGRIELHAWIETR